MKNQLHTDWKFLDSNDLATLDIGAGTVTVTDIDTGKGKKYRIHRVYHDIAKAAYERGIKNRLPWV